MNIMNRLTWRHLVKNKRRTLVTIIGVIISVAMITAVITLAESFINFAKNEHIANEGEWHFTYENVTDEQLQHIKADQSTDKVILTNELGYSILDESKNPSKPYIHITAYDDVGFQQFPVHVLEGRLPEAADELLIPEHMVTNGQIDVAIGDRITANIGNRKTNDADFTDYYLDQTFSLITSSDDEKAETIDVKEEKEYTIVGIMERPRWEPYFAPGYTSLTYISETDRTAPESVDVSVVWHQVNKRTLKNAEQLGKSLNIENFAPNDYLLRYDGLIEQDFLRISLYSVVTIIMLVIVVGSVSLIYNAFAISVAERSQYLGMLSSVGATRQQRRNSVFFEGAMIGLISIPLGILFGIGGISLTLKFIEPIVQSLVDVQTSLTVKTTPLAIILTAVIALLTIFISAYIPARRASKLSAIDAIRQTEDIKLTHKKVRTTKLTRKLFGIEGEFALKNLKRQKRRYYVTVFSFVISIVLFLSVSFFVDQIRITSEYAIANYNYDMSVSPKVDNERFNDDYIKSVRLIDEITEFTQITSSHLFRTQLEESYIHQSLTEILTDGKADLYLGLHALDDESLSAYVEKIGINATTLDDEESLNGIVINRSATPDEKLGETTSLFVESGDQLPLSLYDIEDSKYKDIEPLQVVAVTDERPHGITLAPNVENVDIILSEKTFWKLYEKYSMTFSSQIILSSTDPMRTHEKLDKITDDQMMIFNPHMNKQEEKNILLIVSIFTYGFITLITLISIANIFNTISTSISLRTREFGMLKSVGMTPKGFNRMIRYESLFYGIKALLFGLPISLGIMYLIYRAIAGSFAYPFTLPWGSIIGVIVTIFIIVSLAMMYASSKIKNENIIDVLKRDYT